ncbi:hypothetical protein, partial [Microcoleus sp. D3_18a_C4]|uniref:hypothetical protein n=1 Tax=Microcoleus sp. D3_18a_C4 TaxID=3055332 RepID=UPI002FD10CAC
VGEPAPCILKESVDRHVMDSIEPTFRRSSPQVSDGTDSQAIKPTSGRSYRLFKVNLKKQGKFRTNGSVTGESASYRTSAIGEVGPPLRHS